MKTDFEPLHQVERFVFHEAGCMDRHAYDGWLALRDPDLEYWVSCDAEDTDASTRISLVHDRREQLEQRIRRLEGPHAFARQPRSRLNRVVSNVRLGECTEDALVVSSSFVLGECRLGSQMVWFGRNLHTLSRHADGLRIRCKKVMLLDSDAPLGNFPNLQPINDQIRLIRPIGPDKTEVLMFAVRLKGVSDAINQARLRGQEYFYGPAGAGSPETTARCSNGCSAA